MEHKEKDLRGTTEFFYKSLSKEDEQILHLYKRIEAISGAIFLITNQIKDTELSKKALRERTLSALLITSSILSCSPKTLQRWKTIRADLTAIHSLLDISFWAGLLSQMNISLIQKEILKTLEILDLAQSISSNENNLKNIIFPEDNSIGHSISLKDIKDIIKDTTNYTHDSRVSISARRDKILILLKGSGSRNIKDIAKEFPDVSQKTIQRELLSLINEHLIKKEGDRRWSIYSLLNTGKDL